MWKEHTPPPFKNMPDTYSFLVRHSILWRLSYEITQPKFFHIPYLWFCGYVNCSTQYTHTHTHTHRQAQTHMKTDTDAYKGRCACAVRKELNAWQSVGKSACVLLCPCSLFMRKGLSRAFDIYEPDLVVSTGHRTQRAWSHRRTQEQGQAGATRLLQATRLRFAQRTELHMNDILHRACAAYMLCCVCVCVCVCVCMQVSVHPLMQHVPIRILRQRIKAKQMDPCNFATVITDFTTCHNTWFHTQATRCFVPTEYCAMLARDNGLEDEQIVMHGTRS